MENARENLTVASDEHADSSRTDKVARHVAGGGCRTSDCDGGRERMATFTVASGRTSRCNHRGNFPRAVCLVGGRWRAST